MPTPKIIVTDENGQRELEGQELQDFLAQQQKDQAEAELLLAQVQAKKQTRAALLARLNITEEEARILLGGN